MNQLLPLRFLTVGLLTATLFVGCADEPVVGAVRNVSGGSKAKGPRQKGAKAKGAGVGMPSAKRPSSKEPSAKEPSANGPSKKEPKANLPQASDPKADRPDAKGDGPANPGTAAQNSGKRVAPGTTPSESKPATPPKSQPTPESELEQTMPEGQASIIAARFKGDTLHLRITAPSGGHEFKLIKVEPKAKDSAVRICFVTPGEAEATTTALVDHDLETPITTKGGTVRVYLQVRQRGAQYFVEPEFKLVETLSH